MSKETQLDKLLESINAKLTPEGSARPIAYRGTNFAPVNKVPCESYALGYLLGGGWYEGKLHEFFGPEHAGKTTLMFLALLDCYRYYEGKRYVAIIDVEHRFNPEWAEKMGLHVDENLIIIQPPNAEVATDAMHRLVKSQMVCAIGFDSIGAAAGWREQQEFDEQATMYGGNAAIMARNVKTIAPLANLYNVTIFYLNQLRADMQGYNRPMTPGGHAVKHQMSLRLYLRRGKEKYMDKTLEGDVQVGYPMVFKTVKNSYGPSPREQWSDFYFEPSKWLDRIGFDVDKELQRLGILTGVIEQSSSWYTFDGIKGNGRDNFFKEIAKAKAEERLAAAVLQSLSGRMPDLLPLELPDDLQRPDAAGPDIDDPEV